VLFQETHGWPPDEAAARATARRDLVVGAAASQGLQAAAYAVDGLDSPVLTAQGAAGPREVRAVTATSLTVHGRPPTRAFEVG
jgi:hypothetical protein